MGSDLLIGQSVGLQSAISSCQFAIYIESSWVLLIYILASNERLNCNHACLSSNRAPNKFLSFTGGNEKVANLGKIWFIILKRQI